MKHIIAWQKYGETFRWDLQVGRCFWFGARGGALDFLELS